MSEKIISVIGPGQRASESNISQALQVGELLARAGYTVLTGGRNVGIMNAALKGAKQGGGKTIAVLPTKDNSDVSAFADYVICTGMSGARNYIISLTGEAVVCCGICEGTASEVAHALNNKKRVVIIGATPEAESFFTSLAPSLVAIAQSPDQAILLLTP